MFYLSGYSKVYHWHLAREVLSCELFFLWRRAPQQKLWWRWRERWSVFSIFQVTEHRWNEIDRGKASNRGKTCPSATLSITNPTWTDAEFFFLSLFSFDPFCTFKSIHPSSCHLRSILLSLYNKHNTNIHDPGRIRTHNPSKRTAADPRLRPRGHWDRQGIEPEPPRWEAGD